MTTLSRKSIHVVALAATLLATVSASTQPTMAECGRPDQPVELASDSGLDPTGIDPCGCLRALRTCVLAAASSLSDCRSDVPRPTREALCHLEFELDVLLCLERAGVCRGICRP